MKSTENQTFRQKAFFILKLTFGIFLLVILIRWNNNAQKVLTIFSNFKWTYLIGLLSLALLMSWVNSLKWNLFLREHSITVSVRRLCGLYIIGYFFNNFFPSMVGGDLTRIYLLGNQIKSQAKSAASVFLQRFTGFLALLILALVFALLNYNLLTNPLIGISFGCIALTFIVIIFILLSPRFMDSLAKKIQSFPVLYKFVSKIMRIYEEITFFNKRPKPLLFAMNYSFLFHFLTCVNVYLCCLSLGFNPPFLTIATVTPIILLLNSIPVSFNNIGWWEWSFSVLLMSVGGGAELGLAVALLLRGITLIISFFGGILFLLEKIT